MHALSTREVFLFTITFILESIFHSVVKRVIIKFVFYGFLSVLGSLCRRKLLHLL